MTSSGSTTMASDTEPSTSMRVASGDGATNGQTTGRRPKRSEAGPPTSRPGIRVSAYTRNNPATASAPRPSSWRYTMSIGENWLAPQPTANIANAILTQAAEPLPVTVAVAMTSTLTR